MKKTRQLQDAVSCIVCGKGPVSAFNRPRSLHKTKRVVRPNLVKFDDDGTKICTRCLKTQRHLLAA